MSTPPTPRPPATASLRTNTTAFERELIELRAGERKIEYRTVVMSKLVHTQNKIIMDELEKLGV